MTSVNILAFDGCEEIELFGFADVLNRCGVEFRLVSPFADELITTRCGVKVLSQPKFENADALYIPGGQISDAFAKFMQQNQAEFSEQTAQFVSGGGIFVANCIAPALLAHAGAFDGVADWEITAYPGTEVGNIPPEHFRAEAVVASHNIITGNGPSSTIQLAVELIRRFRSADEMEAVKKEILAMGFSGEF
jgi:putative intracellular protease/amidase